jgi:hypothetical protein
MDEANAEEDVLVGDGESAGRGSAAHKALNRVPRIGSKEADRDGPEIETGAESCMPEMLMMRVTLGCGVLAVKNPNPSAGCMTNHGATRSAIANTSAEGKADIGSRCPNVCF